MKVGLLCFSCSALLQYDFGSTSLGSVCEKCITPNSYVWLFSLCLSYFRVTRGTRQLNSNFLPHVRRLPLSVLKVHSSVRVTWCLCSWMSSSSGATWRKMLEVKSEIMNCCKYVNPSSVMQIVPYLCCICMYVRLRLFSACVLGICGNNTGNVQVHIT